MIKKFFEKIIEFTCLLVGLVGFQVFGNALLGNKGIFIADVIFILLILYFLNKESKK